MLPPEDQAALDDAARMLTESSPPMRLAARLGTLAGRGLDPLMGALPGPVRARVRIAAVDAADRALNVAWRTVLPTLGARLPGVVPARLAERAAMIATGAAGGAAGLAGTAVEVPFTTALLLRAIGRIAAEEGEDVADERVRAECLKVLALGALAGGEAPAAAYQAVRLAWAEALGMAANKAVSEAMPRLIGVVLPRFGLNVTWKLAGQAVPVIGAASGALINLAFAAHYQVKARGHFVVRRLERRYGEDAVRAAWPGGAGPDVPFTEP